MPLSFRASKDLEIENFSEEDEKNLNFLIAAYGKHKPVREEERQLECLQLLKSSAIIGRRILSYFKKSAIVITVNINPFERKRDN